MKEILWKIINLIQTTNSFVLASHTDPDGDSIGSLMALGMFLKQLGKNVYIQMRENVPPKYAFLIKDLTYCSDNVNDPEVFVVLDTSSIDRIDKVANHLNTQEAFILNIDHHGDNLHFGDLNWVDPAYPAVGVMVFQILKEMGAEFTPLIATNLYTAILTDTGGFMFSNTTPEVLEQAAFLTKKGATPGWIASQVYLNHSKNYLINVGIALNNLQFYMDDQILFMVMDNRSVLRSSSSFSETEGIVDFTLKVKGVKVGVLFKEVQREHIRISMRSNGFVDVAHICAEFGGGGHHNAAGCTFYDTLENSQQTILQKIINVLKAQNEEWRTVNK
ncbi:bifunctional oligoribonuclease/PAP phosphatase NrnA [bacterium]|nr:bifunctional oligoribonuclease/PAP phosphatase NrnA [bacterium]